jgi:hypothetical protein
VALTLTAFAAGMASILLAVIVIVSDDISLSASV